MRYLAKQILKMASLMAMLLFSVSSLAEVNPFKKTKNYNFGSDIGWYEKSGAAMKSGSVKDGKDINYYHLNINKSRILLRMARNDPSGELQNTRLLDSLSITEVEIDEERLGIFDWCLRNQQVPGRELKQNAVVANDICVNAGGGGDFVIRLDQRTREALMKAGKLEFVVEPYGRPVRLTYDMAGFEEIMAGLLKPAPAPAPVAKPIVKPVVEAPKPVVKAEPKPKPKVVKMCKALAPANLQSVISPVVYPCDNTAKKQAAESRINASVADHRKKLEQKKEMERKQEQARLQEEQDRQRQAEWDKRQEEMWVSRCQRHWKKGSSPCYCEKYLSQAPPGTVSTCDN